VEGWSEVLESIGGKARNAGACLVLSARILILAGLILAGLAVPGPATAQDITYFRIGTGPSDSTYFPIGGLLANIVSNPPGSRACDEGGSCGVPGLIAVAQSTAGALYNLEAIGRGELESGLSQADIAHWAFNGLGPFAESGEISNLSAIANLYAEAIHIVVRKDSGIAEIADLAGKRVSLGPLQSGTRVEAEIILDAYGLSPTDMEALDLLPGPASDRMREGELDAFFVVGGVPVKAVSDLVEDVAIALLPLGGEEARRLVARYPFLAVGVIPAAAYQSTRNTLTIAVGAEWIVSTAVEEELVYGLTRALWHPSARELLDHGHPDGRRIQLATALHGLSIPLHPGAERYYREVGLIGAPADPARDGTAEDREKVPVEAE
jgi:TRAP transporter TAXI family solute receptor